MGLLLILVDVLATVAVAFAATATSASQSTSITLTTKAPSSTTIVEPCALASRASSSFAAANPSATTVTIPAEIAYNCLETIPNHPEPALALLDALNPLIEFQSTIPYLKNPPSGYLFPAVDIEQGLADIAANVAAGAYESEYDFQTDLQSLIISARDGHFSYNGDATHIFGFKRILPLVSISPDGSQIPQVFAQEDLVTGFVPRNTTFNPSPIINIDNIDAVTFLLAQSLINNIQDPDASYNYAFYELAQITIGAGNGVFTMPGFYPGPSTTLVFANGTIRTIQNLAEVERKLDSIADGDDMYSSFCIPSTSTAVASAAATSSGEQFTSTAAASSSSASSHAPAPTSPGYPYPVKKHSQNYVAGYFLNGTGYQAVAVLSIPSYVPQGTGAEREFQQVVQSFLASAKEAGKTKLIVDLQANAGGIADLALDTFAQLFPSIKPNTQGNGAANVGLDILGQTLSNLEAGAQNQTARDNHIGIPFTVQGLMKLDGSGFASWPAYFGPVELHGGNFTNLFQENYTDLAVTDKGDRIVITGTNNRTDFTQPFGAMDVIMLYDGYCASTCAIFAELMKNLAGIQSIAVGGRPQLGPMQGVGGVKGSSIEKFGTFIPGIEVTLREANKSVVAEGQGTLFANFSSVNLALQRSSSPSIAGGVDFRNNIRIGDSSLTPLQFVYEASDCRIWYTKEMLSDPNFLWKRVTDIAFNNNGTAFSSPYCIKGSTGQPTSLSGGHKNGSLGPQTPPPGAKSSVEGWLINGTSIQNSTGSTPAMLKKNVTASVSSTGAASGTGAGSPAQSTGGTGRLASSWTAKVMPALVAAVVGLVVI